jgi:hypothetical protein
MKSCRYRVSRSSRFGYNPGSVRALPDDDAGEWEHLLFRQHGVVSRRQALRYLTDRAVRHRIRSGRWQNPHRGVFVTHGGPLTERQRKWIAVLAVGSVGHGRGAILGGLSALGVLGMRRYSSPDIHVLIAAHKQETDPPRGVVVHRTRILPPEDRHMTGDPPCTMPARSLVDAAQWARSDRDAIAVIAAAFQQRLVGVQDMRPVLARMPRIKRRALIVAAVDDAAAGAESISEVEFARLCRRAGLPDPSRQVARMDAGGRKRYRDVYFDDWKVHVEIDGGQHIEVRAWHADMWQHNEVAIAGERLLRFPAWAVRHCPDKVISQLRAALVAAGWRP